MIEPFRVVKLKLKEEDVDCQGRVQSRPDSLRRPDDTIRDGSRRGKRT